MTDDFYNRFGHEYDNNNPEDVINISILVDEDSDKYLKQYQDTLSHYHMKVIFIK